MNKLTILLITLYCNITLAEDCKYGKDVLNTKSLKDITKFGTEMQKKLLTQPWLQCHYKGYSVSCDEYERLINEQKEDGLDPNLYIP